MQNRTHQVLFRLNDEEYRKLAEKVRKSGRSRESYIRSVLDGYKMKEQPNADFSKVLKELNRISNNLNQIAAKANALNFITVDEYRKNAADLRAATAELLRRVYS